MPRVSRPPTSGRVAFAVGLATVVLAGLPGLGAAQASKAADQVVEGAKKTGQGIEQTAKGIGKTMYVKVPIDETTTEREVARAAALVSELPEPPPFFLQPIVSPANVPCISPDRMERFYDVASSCLSDVRVLPQAHKALGIR